jgi:hypothetical protein
VTLSWAAAFFGTVPAPNTEKEKRKEKEKDTKRIAT